MESGSDSACSEPVRHERNGTTWHRPPGCSTSWLSLFGILATRSYGHGVRRMIPKALFTRRSTLYAKGRLLPPRLGTSPFSGENRVELHDSLSALVTEVCDKVLPAAGQHRPAQSGFRHTSETRYSGRTFPKVREQPWRLLGFQDPPLALGELSTGLSDIVAVLTEMSAGPDSVRKVINAGRSGTAQRCPLPRRRKVAEMDSPASSWNEEER